jgi:hypothetical protein
MCVCEKAACYHGFGTLLRDFVYGARKQGNSIYKKSAIYVQHILRVATLCSSVKERHTERKITPSSSESKTNPSKEKISKKQASSSYKT